MRVLANRWIVLIGMAGFSVAVALILAHVQPTAPWIARLDFVFYDTFYNRRPTEDQTGGPLVIVAADDESLQRMVAEKQLGWPWPRDQWAAIVDFAREQHAREVVFDVLFTEPSVFNRTFADDAALADAVTAAEAAGIPVVFADMAENDHDGRFAIPIKRPRLGATNQANESVLRTFSPIINGRPSLPVAALDAIGLKTGADPLLVHYYGPSGHGRQKTFRYVSAADVVDAQIGNAEAKKRIEPSSFRDKIVVIGAITPGTYDLKVSPYSAIYPGVEFEATAITNLMRDQRVVLITARVGYLILFASAATASLGAGLPRRSLIKIALAFVGIVGPIVLSGALFSGSNIRWLPPTVSILAASLSMMLALVWSYLIEDRQRRFFLKALGQYVSPAVADELGRHREKLRIGSERRTMTVLFSDIAGFTGRSETMEPQAVGEFLNSYLQTMSAIVLEFDGTLDKYVGDSIMAFWNAPLDQPDHALRAVRAAMKMRQAAIESGIGTRIGINTGPMAVGNMGSSVKFNYSALGDAVNLGSRLEAANKIYGTRVLLSETTAARVRDQIPLRKIDLLRVKGKQTAIGVFEPLTVDSAHIGPAYERAWAAYQQQQWDVAESALRNFTDDPPSRVLLDRIAEFRTMPPPPDWIGVFIAFDK